MAALALAVPSTIRISEPYHNHHAPRRPNMTMTMTVTMPVPIRRAIRYRCPILTSCQATMLSSEMCDHITSEHPKRAPQTLVVNSGTPMKYKFCSQNSSWEKLKTGGKFFYRLYRAEHPTNVGAYVGANDGTEHALIAIFATVERQGGRLVLAPHTLAATKGMDTGKLRLKVEVPLTDDQTVLLRLKPKRSTRTLSGDAKKVRGAALPRAAPFSFATSSLKYEGAAEAEGESGDMAAMSWSVSAISV